MCSNIQDQKCSFQYKTKILDWPEGKTRLHPCRQQPDIPLDLKSSTILVYVILNGKGLTGLVSYMIRNVQLKQHENNWKLDILKTNRKA